MKPHNSQYTNLKTEILRKQPNPMQTNRRFTHKQKQNRSHFQRRSMQSEQKQIKQNQHAVIHKHMDFFHLKQSIQATKAKNQLLYFNPIFHDQFQLRENIKNQINSCVSQQSNLSKQLSITQNFKKGNKQLKAPTNGKKCRLAEFQQVQNYVNSQLGQIGQKIATSSLQPDNLGKQPTQLQSDKKQSSDVVSKAQKRKRAWTSREKYNMQKYQNYESIMNSTRIAKRSLSTLQNHYYENKTINKSQILNSKYKIIKSKLPLKTTQYSLTLIPCQQSWKSYHPTQNLLNLQNKKSIAIHSQRSKQKQRSKDGKMRRKPTMDFNDFYLKGNIIQIQDIPLLGEENQQKEKKQFDSITAEYAISHKAVAPYRKNRKLLKDQSQRGQWVAKNTNKNENRINSNANISRVYEINSNINIKMKDQITKIMKLLKQEQQYSNFI